MKSLLFAMPGNENFADRLVAALGAELGAVETRCFPDGESYVRLAIVCTLDRPNNKTLLLLFTAHAAHDLGASSVGLVAPYLGYMRQDKRFRPGEAITSSAFGRLLSSSFDWIVTVDPHLHRWTSMSEIYSIPVGVCHAAPKLSACASTWQMHSLSVPTSRASNGSAPSQRTLVCPTSPLKKPGVEIATLGSRSRIWNDGGAKDRSWSMTLSLPAEPWRSPSRI